MQNDQLIDEYITWLRDTKGASSITVYDYSSILRRWQDWVANAPFANATVAQMEEFVRRPRKSGRPGAPATQQKDAVAIREMYKFLHARGRIPRDPSRLLITPTVRNVQPKPVPDEMWQTLWWADLPACDRLAMGLGFFGGLRRAEICSLRVGHYARGQLVNFIRKGGGEDILPISDLCDALLKTHPQLGAAQFIPLLEAATWKKDSNDLLVDFQVRQSAWRVYRQHFDGTNPDVLNKRMSLICERLSVPRVTPHMLRHSFVTNLLRAQVPLHIVSRMANHTSPTVTARYIKAGGNELKEWMRSVAPTP